MNGLNQKKYLLIFIAIFILIFMTSCKETSIKFEKRGNINETNELSCNSVGGVWGSFCSNSENFCVKKYSDGGKICHSSKDCIGNCFKNSDENEYRCEETPVTCGCFTNPEGDGICYD